MSEWDDNEDDIDDDGEPVRSRRPIVIGVLALLVLALAAVIAYRVSSNKDSGAASGATATSAPAGANTVDGASTTTVAVEAPLPADASVDPTTTVVGATAVPSAPSSAAPTTPAVAATTATTAAPTTAAATTAATVAPTTAGAVAPTDAPTPGGAAQPVTYATLPDGTAAPIIAVFGADKVTLSGNVPDQAAKDYLQGLAIANSRTPVPVVNLLTIDPTAPRAIGVRVVELTSARFAEGSAQVAGAHAAELDRITAIMNSLPNVTVLIIGHADQIGSSTANYALSAQRAAAVVAYLVRSGVNPARLSSRAVGDTDLLTLNSDDASLALNRRTEFIIYGILGP